MASRKATLILKLGDNEIRYEAEREAVEAQLEQVLDRLLRQAPAEVRVGIPGAAEATSPTGRPSSTPVPAAPMPAAPVQAASETQQLKRLFRIGSGRRLRLRKLPGRTVDALLLVLYGMLKLQGRKAVHAPGMTSAARASGARFERADRLFAGHDDLVEGFGQRRSKRYRLTAAGREHCARLVASLVASLPPAPATPPPGEAAGQAEVGGIPKKVTSRWQGELLTVTETAERLGIDEAEVGRLRRKLELLGLPGGDRKRRRYFYPAFQIDAERREIYPQARQATRIVSDLWTTWTVADWWSSVEPRLDRKPMELIGTPEADAVVAAAKARVHVSD